MGQDTVMTFINCYKYNTEKTIIFPRMNSLLQVILLYVLMTINNTIVFKAPFFH